MSRQCLACNKRVYSIRNGKLRTVNCIMIEIYAACLIGADIELALRRASAAANAAAVWLLPTTDPLRAPSEPTLPLT